MMYDWSKFEIFFYFNVPVRDVFKAWTTSQGLESFFVKRAEISSAVSKKRAACETVQNGDQYLWDWFFDHQSSGKFNEIETERSLSFTFGKCIVKIELTQHETGTLLRLQQSGMDASEGDRVNLHLDCRGGWIYFLMNLKAVLENGIDVRDKRPDTSRSLEVGWQP